MQNHHRSSMYIFIRLRTPPFYLLLCTCLSLSCSLFDFPSESAPDLSFSLSPICIPTRGIFSNHKSDPLSVLLKILLCSSLLIKCKHLHLTHMVESPSPCLSKCSRPGLLPPPWNRKPILHSSYLPLCLSCLSMNITARLLQQVRSHHTAGPSCSLINPTRLEALGGKFTVSLSSSQLEHSNQHTGSDVQLLAEWVNSKPAGQMENPIHSATHLAMKTLYSTDRCVHNAASYFFPTLAYGVKWWLC